MGTPRPKWGAVPVQLAGWVWVGEGGSPLGRAEQARGWGGDTGMLHPLLMSLAAQNMGLLGAGVARDLGHHPPGPCASGTPWRQWEAASPHPHREKKEGATCPSSQGCSPPNPAWPTACLFPHPLPDQRGRPGHQPSSGPLSSWDPLQAFWLLAS